MCAPAPTTGPSILSAIALSSSSIYVNWSILTEQELNGVLQGYQVEYIDADGENTTVDFNKSVTFTILRNLYFFTEYNISVKAKTNPGFGPYGVVAAVTTKEDGEFKLYFAEHVQCIDI